MVPGGDSGRRAQPSPLCAGWHRSCWQRGRSVAGLGVWTDASRLCPAAAHPGPFSAPTATASMRGKTPLPAPEPGGTRKLPRLQTLDQLLCSIACCACPVASLLLLMFWAQLCLLRLPAALEMQLFPASGMAGLSCQPVLGTVQFGETPVSPAALLAPPGRGGTPRWLCWQRSPACAASGH